MSKVSNEKMVSIFIREQWELRHTYMIEYKIPESEYKKHLENKTSMSDMCVEYLDEGGLLSTVEHEDLEKHEDGWTLTDSNWGEKEQKIDLWDYEFE